jgi:hypothetical protein
VEKGFSPMNSTPKNGGNIVRIELRLRELAQLFNSLDPSPFVDRDLDPNAEEFIEGWAREHHQETEFELTLHLSVPPPPDRAQGVEEAVRHYFAARAEVKRRQFRQLMRRGRISLFIGLVFLTGCLFLSELVSKVGSGAAAGILRESLLIGGWVAMWRPLEIYLYDWWPLREDRRLVERLARMQVRLILPQT